ncbi:1,2-dihydroxy-3-keto-5-methylthiopentene dioxygenase [Paxillus ammoniavirescens]|nr:1,2-dihydroxy-3-keto-5-methylthiopentene dioxygenase [Paxillus ammoniavirescens]
MRAFYYDHLPGDPRLPHDSGKPVEDSVLESIGVFLWNIPVHADGTYPDVLARAAERGSNNHDVVTVTKESLGDQYESTLKSFYEEHLHEHEEVRYILEGSGWFDVRDHATDSLVRIQLVVGDFMIAPAGIYHRFILDENDMIKAVRMFNDEPKWTPHVRGESTDVNPYRLEYLNSITVN